MTDQASVLRQKVEEHGQVSGPLEELLKPFGYGELTPEALTVVATLMSDAGLKVTPSLSRGRLKAKTKVRVNLDPAVAKAMPVKVNGAGVGAAVLGAAAMALGTFLPMTDNTATLARITQNSLIQHGGWPLIVIALGIAASVYRSHTERRRSWAPIVLGVIGVGIAYATGTSHDTLTVYPLDQFGNPDTTQAGTTLSPGIGVWVSGVGGALAAIGGWMMRGSPTQAPEQAATGTTAADQTAGTETKQCPDCAEAVLVAARVCKHCGFRFAPQIG